MKWLRRLVARTAVDLCVRRGIVPRSEIGLAIFRWAQKRNDLRFAAGHPLKSIVDRPPLNTSYALNKRALAWLWHYLQTVRPNCILEMGSGRSTGMFALYVRQMQEQGRKSPIVISLEHDESWHRAASQYLQELNGDRFVRLVLAPIVGRTRSELRYGIELPQLSALLEGRRIDLLLIDGPPGDVVGRQNTLPFMLPLLADGADVFLDDAYREAEQNLCREWHSRYQDRLQLQGTLPLGPGLGWIKMKTQRARQAAAA